jgi:signal transduction histidine kinase
MGRKGAPVLAGTAAVALAAAVELRVGLGGHVPPAVAISDFLSCCAFIVAGVVAWRRRPQSLTGPLLLLAGVGLAPVNLMFVDDSAVLRTLGLMGLQTFAPSLLHLLLAFPSGRLGLRRHRTFVVAGYLHLTVVFWVLLLFYEPPPGCTACLDGNLLGVLADRETWEVLRVLHALGNLAIGTAVVAILTGRFLRATPAGRRVLAPVLVAGTVVALISVATAPFAYDMLDGTVAPTSLQAVWGIAWWSLPASIMVAVSRTRASRLNLGELLERLAQRPRPLGLRDALADALGDPSLELGFWVESSGGWRDVHGRPLAPRAGGPPRAAMELSRDGRRQALLVHDPHLLEDEAALEAVRAAAAVAIDTERLQAELRARLADAIAAQGRLQRAADDARSRIERELRAGPQRRLLDLSATLAMLPSALPRERQEDLRPLVDATSGLVARARDELRDLAAGVYPSALQREGLAAALEDLAGVSPLPVRLDVEPDAGEGLPQPVAAAAWFACREAIANAAKHAGAEGIEVRLGQADGELRLEVIDDGAGGADPEGSGLRGLADRMAALGGRLEVESAPGRGTAVRARLPAGVAA